MGVAAGRRRAGAGQLDRGAVLRPTLEDLLSEVTGREEDDHRQRIAEMNPRRTCGGHGQVGSRSISSRVAWMPPRASVTSLTPARFAASTRR